MLHYKHQWDASFPEHGPVMLRHHSAMTRALDRHLPCKGFYNYLDNHKTCAGSNDEWLKAHFRDVERMKRIKHAADPHGTFRSRLVEKPSSTPAPPVSANPVRAGNSTSARMPAGNSTS